MGTKAMASSGDLSSIGTFERFLASNDSLWVYEGSKLLFRSTASGILPLIQYVKKRKRTRAEVIIFDRILGNAAALLAVKGGCRVAYSPIGSQLAINTLERYYVVHHITTIVPYIRQTTIDEMCPMERLSVGKDPETFYMAVKNLARSRLHVTTT